MEAQWCHLKKCLDLQARQESARWLRIPGTCLALNKILYFKQIKTILRTKNIRYWSLHNCLLITWNRASLSVKKRIQRLLIALPQRNKLRTIGKNSNVAMLYVVHDGGQDP